MAKHARAWVRSRGAPAVLAGIATLSSGVRAAPLGRWCVGLERLFGVSWVRERTELEYRDVVARDTTFSFLSPAAPHRGYSAPRLALDYLTASGLSLGGAAGIDAVLHHSSDGAPAQIGVSDAVDPTPDELIFVLAPRVGYFFQPLPRLGVWPRIGWTYLAQSGGAGHEALTLDLPLTWLVADERAGFMLAPYLDAGFLEEGQQLIEGGALFSVGMFF